MTLIIAALRRFIETEDFRRMLPVAQHDVRGVLARLIKEEKRKKK